MLYLQGYVTACQVYLLLLRVLSALEVEKLLVNGKTTASLQTNISPKALYQTLQTTEMNF